MREERVEESEWEDVDGAVVAAVVAQSLLEIAGVFRVSHVRGANLG